MKTVSPNIDHSALSCSAKNDVILGDVFLCYEETTTNEIKENQCFKNAQTIESFWQVCVNNYEFVRNNSGFGRKRTRQSEEEEGVKN